VLFDLYRATGQQPQASRAWRIDYAQQFGWSAPQWYSLPKQVADAVAEERPAHPRRHGRSAGSRRPCWTSIRRGRVCGRRRCRCRCPGCFDWAALRRIDTEAAMQLSMLFRLWARRRWKCAGSSGDQLFTVLAEAAPTGVRDADPAFWLTRWTRLRLVNRPTSSTRRPSTTASPTRCRRRPGSPRAATCASVGLTVHAPAPGVDS
jgi:hypothetical protein